MDETSCTNRGSSPSNYFDQELLASVGVSHATRWVKMQIVFFYNAARRRWWDLMRWFGMSWVMPRFVKDLLLSWKKLEKEQCMECCSLTLLWIILRGKMRAFEGVEMNVGQLRSVSDHLFIFGALIQFLVIQMKELLSFGRFFTFWNTSCRWPILALLINEILFTQIDKNKKDMFRVQNGKNIIYNIEAYTQKCQRI